MEKEDGAGNKIWLENNLSSNIKKVPQTTYILAKDQFDTQLQKSIVQFLDASGLTWQTLLTSAWGILLSRLSTANKQVYGVGVSSSIQAGKIKIDSQIKIIKSQISSELTAKQFLNKIKPQLSKKTSLFANSGAHLRYVILFNDIKNKKIKNITLNPEEIPLILLANNTQKEFTLFYSKILYSKKNITKISSYLKNILFDLCNNPYKKAYSIELLSTQEKNKILNNWSHPEYEFPIPLLNHCAHDLISMVANMYPTNIAIVHNDKTITFEELEKKSTLLAQKLMQLGAARNDHIAVSITRSPMLLIAMLAIFKCGAIYIPINPKYPEEKITYLLNDSQSTLILSDIIDKIPAAFHNITIDTNSTDIFNSINTMNFPVVSPDDIAYIIYTSGTTGNPKGVLIKHKSLINFVAWYKACFNIDHHDRSSQVASQAFDSYLCETIPILANGGSVYIIDDNVKLTPHSFLKVLQEYKITICDLPTAYAQMLFSLEWPQNMSLRHVKIGGEALSKYPMQNFSFDIWNIYGPTETTIETTYKKIFSAGENINLKNKKLPPPIGTPLANSEVYVVDQYMQLSPPGVAGELLIGGENLSPGYLNRVELTKEKFIPHILPNHKDKKLYRTGDLVRWLDNGDLEYIGRIDNQIKVRGYRIELNEVENIIRQHPDVGDAIVIAKDTPNSDKSLIAYVVPNLEKERFPYQERCVITNEKKKHVEVITEDISKSGIAVSGLSEQFRSGEKVKLYLKLPGSNDNKSLSGYIIWQENNRCGVLIDIADNENKIISKSIDYYLTTENIMDLVLRSSAKRSLKKALQKKLPDYMIPSTFVKILQFPLTFSGKIDTKALPPPQEFEQILHKEFIEPKTSTEMKLAKLWKEILDHDTISMSDNFFDIGGSSLTVAELSVRILREFHISLPAKLLFDLSYIPILAEYIDTNGENYRSQCNIQDDIERDNILDDNIIPTGKLSPHIHNPENILLTGAGGFLGIYLLRELLIHTDAKIYCIIRKGSFESAAERFISNISKFDLNNEVTLSNRRIIIIAGDIADEQFGLPQEQYNNLLAKIDLIYHCGAQVNIMASYGKLRGSNVQGTIEIIKFATKVKDKPIQYISTLSSAYRKDANGRLTEEFPNETYDEIFGGYAISKWVSERLLTQIKSRGLPIAIYRSGYIFGQSDTGITSLNDALLMLMKGCIQLGFAPDMHEKITILPVDFVAKVITLIGLKYPEKSTVYHIDHPTGIMWSDLIAWLNNYGYHIKTVSIKEWQNKLSHIEQDNALYPFLPYYLALPADHRSDEVVNDNTIDVLAKMNIKYPDINDELLTIYIDYLCQVEFLPAPLNETKINAGKTIIDTN